MWFDIQGLCCAQQCNITSTLIYKRKLLDEHALCLIMSWCIYNTNFLKSGGIYNITCYRYFEGKITPISEVDDENDVEIPRVRVTEAAEKVHPMNKSWFHIMFQ